MINEEQKLDAFETLFSHLSDKGKAESLNDLVCQPHGSIDVSIVESEELSGLLAKYALLSGITSAALTAENHDGAFVAQSQAHIIFKSTQVSFRKP